MGGNPGGGNGGDSSARCASSSSNTASGSNQGCAGGAMTGASIRGMGCIAGETFPGSGAVAACCCPCGRDELEASDEPHMGSGLANLLRLSGPRRQC